MDAGGTVDQLLAFTSGHPQRTVLLAHHVYNLLDQPAQLDDLATAAIDSRSPRPETPIRLSGMGSVEPNESCC